MPKEIKDIKVFMEKMIQNKDQTKGKAAEKKTSEKTSKVTLTVKQTKDTTKFKLRTPKYLYTFKTTKADLAKKVLSNLPTNVQKIDVKKMVKKIKK